MKRLAALSAILVLSVTAAGCGGSSSKSGSSSGSGGDFALPSNRSGLTLKIYGFGTGDDVANSRAALAKKAVAPAKVQNPSGSFDPQRFLTTLASGNVPDLIYVDRQQIATLAAKGALEPIDGCLTAQNVDKSQYNQAALAEASYGGHLYALPEFTNQRTLIVNEKALQQAGVPLSSISTTNWSTLKTLAKKLTVMKGGKLTRIGFDPKIPEFFIMWAHANGADLLSADGKTAHLDDPKAVEALAFTKSIIDEEGGWQKFKSFRDSWDFFGKQNPVAADQIGFWPMESWYWNVIAENSPNVQVAAVPFTDRNGKPFTFINGSGWAIPKGAKNPGLACTWMKTMTSVPTWIAAAKTRIADNKKSNTPFTGLYTANTVADKKVLALVPKGSDQWTKAVKTLEQVQQNAISWPASPAGAQVQQALTDAINRVLDGQQSPQQALAQAQKEAQTAIDQAAKSG